MRGLLRGEDAFFAVVFNIHCSSAGLFEPLLRKLVITVFSCLFWWLHYHLAVQVGAVYPSRPLFRTVPLAEAWWAAVVPVAGHAMLDLTVVIVTRRCCILRG